MCKQNPSKKNHGFTLLEALLAMAILSTALLLLANSWSASFNRVKKTQLNFELSTLLDRKMSELIREYAGKPITEIPEEKSPPPTPTPAKQNSGLAEKVLNDLNSPTVFISVQIGASKNPGNDNSKFANEEAINIIACTDGYTRYSVGKYLSIAEARKKLNQLKGAGKTDAFLTAFNGNQRITIQEAEKLIKK